MKKKMTKNKAQKSKGSTKKVYKKATATPRSSLVLLNDRVLIRPLSPEEMGTTTASGIIIPDSSREKPDEGVVIAVGAGRYENGHLVPMTVKVGDRVLFDSDSYSRKEKDISGVKHFIVREIEIVAIKN